MFLVYFNRYITHLNLNRELLEWNIGQLTTKTKFKQIFAPERPILGPPHDHTIYLLKRTYALKPSLLNDSPIGCGCLGGGNK